MRVLEDLLNGSYHHTHDNPDFGAYRERFRQLAELELLKKGFCGLLRRDVEKGGRLCRPACALPE